MKRFFNLLAFFLLTIASYAYDVEVDGIYYNLNAGTKEATVTNSATYSYMYSDYTGSVVIPESITSNGTKYKVTEIGVYAFNGCSGLTSISIANSVTHIRQWAFEGCTGLTSVTIPNSVTTVEDWAFMACYGLTTITIGNSVTSIGSSAFSGCSNVNLVFADGCTDMFYIGVSSIGSATIPNSVKWRDDQYGQFWGCKIDEVIVSCKDMNDFASYLSRDDIYRIFKEIGNKHSIMIAGEITDKITIPNSVTSIADYAFYDCSGLTSVTIPSPVACVGLNAFQNCSSLNSVTIGNSVTNIESSAFKNCTSLTSVIIPNSVTSIGDNAFESCSSLTSATIGNSVTSIGDCAFMDCSALASINLPGSVTSVGYGVFENCASLPIIDNIRYADTYLVEATDKSQKEYIIKEGTRIIGDYAFYDCEGLNSVTIPNSVTFIDDFAFKSSGLTTLTIPSSVIRIGESISEGCDNLTSITVAADNPVYDSRNKCNAIIESRSNRLIQGCANSFIPNSVESIGVGAFGYIQTLKSINIPSSVKQIGAYAFDGCENLETVVIGENVGRIDYRAFDECGIKTIYMRATVPPLYWDEEEDERIDEDHMFNEEVYTSATLYVPEDAVAYYRVSDVWKNFKYIKQAPTGITTPLIDTTTKEAPIYNLQGQRQSNLQRGLNIVGGKKQFVK